MFYCSNCKNIYDITNNIDNVISKSEKNIKENVSYFICKTCGFYEPIKNNTLLFTTSKYNKSHYIPTNINAENKINSSTLIKTRNYDCPNKECETHKHPELKLANMERINYNSYKVRYTCFVCHTQWI
jgi:hypothetical protein